MSYVADNPDQWDGKPSVGSGECVALVEKATGAPLARSWSKGKAVKGDLSIPKGTAIATFNAQGRYSSMPTGNHAAIYLGQNALGLQVIDQWSGQPPHKRTIYFNHKGASNDGKGFCVVE